MNKKILLIASALLAFLTTSTQIAKALEITNPLKKLKRIPAKIEDEFEAVTKDFTQGFNSLLKQELELKTNQLRQDLEQNVDNKITKTLEQVSAEIPDYKTWVKNKITQKELRQDLTQIQAGKVLDQEAQAVKRQRGELSLEATKEISNHAKKAQKASITQDIMTEIAGQNEKIASILYLNQKAIEKQTELQATANLNIADIASHLTSRERENQLIRQGATNAVLRDSLALDAFWAGTGRCHNGDC